MSLACPRCGHRRSKMLTSSQVVVQGVQAVRRRRLCAGCGVRFTTREVHNTVFWELLRCARKAASYDVIHDTVVQALQKAKEDGTSLIEKLKSVR